jgi:hypothetical protein
MGAVMPDSRQRRSRDGREPITFRGGPCDGEHQRVLVTTNRLMVVGAPVPSRKGAIYMQTEDPLVFAFTGYQPLRMGP